MITVLWIESVRDAETLGDLFGKMEETMSDFDVYMADQRDRDEAKWLESRPVCSVCGEHIQEDECYKVDGELICKDCMDDMRVQTEYYVEDRKYGDY